MVHRFDKGTVKNSRQSHNKVHRARRGSPPRRPWCRRLQQAAAAAAALAALGQGAPAVALPCARSLTWSKLWEQQLPSRDPAGHTIGGFSAIRFDAASRQLWLLSDLPEAPISRWSAPTAAAPPLLVVSLQTTGGPGPLDGEGLVLAGDQLWIASEGRRSAERPALLLRLSRSDARVLQAVALPEDWQPADGRGLGSNAGPESLTALHASDQPLELLMAAERPLLQDPPQQVRLLRWSWPRGIDPRRAAPIARPQGALALPDATPWGVTDLVALPATAGQPTLLLALLRRYEPPNSWQNRLLLYALPLPGQVAPPLRQWDLQQLGLTPENWEGLTLGPVLRGGQISLLLVSDDNLNPLQTSRLAMLAASATPPCRTAP